MNITFYSIVADQCNKGKRFWEPKVLINDVKAVMGTLKGEEYPKLSHPNLDPTTIIMVAKTICKVMMIVCPFVDGL